MLFGYTQPVDTTATSPLQFRSKLEDVLICVPESKDFYIALQPRCVKVVQQWQSTNQGTFPAVQ